MIVDLIDQAFLFLPLALGIYFSYSILKIPDLTVEGSFILGASLFAAVLERGGGPILATVSALAGGGLSGLTVSLIQSKNRISPLIAGILMVFILNALSLIIMQTPLISLSTKLFLFEGTFLPLSRFTALVLITVLVGIGLAWVLHSRFGLVLRAYGQNRVLLALYGKNPEIYRRTGLIIGNMLAALSGILTAYANGYADVNMGIGLALIGIGTVILGHQLQHHFLKKTSEVLGLLFCVLGVTLYFLVFNLFLMIGVEPLYLKLLVGVFLIAILWNRAPEALRGGNL